jgi:hypothetical protein
MENQEPQQKGNQKPRQDGDQEPQQHGYQEPQQNEDEPGATQQNENRPETTAGRTWTRSHSRTKMNQKPKLDENQKPPGRR